MNHLRRGHQQELLVPIAIVCLLISILLPSIARVRENARFKTLFPIDTAAWNEGKVSTKTIQFLSKDDADDIKALKKGIAALKTTPKYKGEKLLIDLEGNITQGPHPIGYILIAGEGSAVTTEDAVIITFTAYHGGKYTISVRNDKMGNYIIEHAPSK